MRVFLGFCCVLAVSCVAFGQDKDDLEYWNSSNESGPEDWYQDIDTRDRGTDNNKREEIRVISRDSQDGIPDSEADSSASASQNDEYQVEDNRSVADEDKDVEGMKLSEGNYNSKDSENAVESIELINANIEAALTETKDLLNESGSNFEYSMENDDAEKKLDKVKDMEESRDSNDEDNEKNIDNNSNINSSDNSMQDNVDNNEKVLSLKDIFDNINRDYDNKDLSNSADKVDDLSDMVENLKKYDNLSKDLEKYFEESNKHDSRVESSEQKLSGEIVENQGEAFSFVGENNENAEDSRGDLEKSIFDMSNQENQNFGEMNNNPFEDNLEQKIHKNIVDTYEDLNEDIEKLFNAIRSDSKMDDYDDVSMGKIQNDQNLDDEISLSNNNQKIDTHKSNEETDIDGADSNLLSKDKSNNTNNIENLVSNQLETVNKVKKYTESEVTELMSQFMVEHTKDVDVTDPEFDTNTAVIHIPINYVEPIVIASPNYPDPYPSNNIVDWIFEGDGMGIELNMTEFSVNGNRGDFLLVKPGGMDGSDHEGIIFSYNLNSERKYRFTNVDKLFMRFQSHEGTNLYTGFSFSIKFIGPRPRLPEPIPEPEPSVPVIRYTHTIYFGGVTPEEFGVMRDDLQSIIADMATYYILTNDIPFGEMDTTQVTNITRVFVCNINWPEYDNCAAITFGVPLKYPEDSDLEHRLTDKDLKDMWDTFSVQEPFVTRIGRLGVTEFSVPNDRMVLMIWLIIGFGALISAVLLSIVLWKWNCFEDYSRMPNYSDTEAVLSKNNKDVGLYPTPYQDLPALYADQVLDYKFPPGLAATPDDARVNMGGFNNSSFVRDDGLYRDDSDEDVMRNTGGRKNRLTTDV